MPDITIKLKPYLQDYLRCTINEPLMAKNDSFVNSALRPLLSYRPSNEPYTPHTGPKYITFELPNYDEIQVRGNNVYMDDRNQKYFEKILDNHFKTVFLMYYEMMVREHGKENTKGIILQFCADYKIHFNNDFYETMKKKIYRQKKKDQQDPEKARKYRMRNSHFLML